MNDTISIRLTGRVFLLAPNAHAKFSVYWDMLQAHFQRYPQSVSALDTVEAEVADLLESLLENPTDTVTIDHIQRVIDTLGYSDQWDARFLNPEATANESRSEPRYTRRRFFLDRQRKIISGVCAGLAKYLDAEIVWVRTITVILVILFPPAIIAYGVLWILGPTAENLNPLRHETKTQNPTASSTHNDIANRSARFFSRFIGSVITLVSLIIIIAIIVGSVNLFHSDFTDLGDIRLMTGSKQTLLLIAIVTAVSYPIILLFALGIRFILTRPFPRNTWLYILGMWAVAIIFSIVQIEGIVDRFSTEVAEKQTIPMNSRITSDLTIFTGLTDDADTDRLHMRPRIDFLPNLRSDSVEVDMIRIANGETPAAARRAIQEIDIDLSITGSEIRIPTFFKLPDNAPFRNQQVCIKIRIPDQTRVSINGFHRNFISIQSDDAVIRASFDGSDRYERLPRFRDRLQLTASVSGFTRQ